MEKRFTPITKASSPGHKGSDLLLDFCCRTLKTKKRNEKKAVVTVHHSRRREIATGSKEYAEIKNINNSEEVAGEKTVEVAAEGGRNEEGEQVRYFDLFHNITKRLWEFFNFRPS